MLFRSFRRFGDSETFEQHLRPDALASHPHLSVFGDYYWFLACFVMLGLIPLAFLALFPGARPRSYGLGLGDWRFGFACTGVAFLGMSVVVAIVAQGDLFSNYYPLNDHLGTEAVAWVTGKGAIHDDFVWTFLAFELLYAVYFLGWEWFFRGFLTFGLYDHIGVNGVWIGTIPFALMHVNKPFPEALGSIVAGIALGLFALRARSFWYHWVIHVAIAWSRLPTAPLYSPLAARSSAWTSWAAPR